MMDIVNDLWRSKNVEEILLVDVDDREIGYTTKEDAHKYGKLHRAFSVFLFHGDKMLIQKRNIHKYHSGGLWTNSCCSHQRRGESLEEAVRRCMECELGVVTELSEAFHFIYRTKFSEELYEYEIDHVFVGEFDGSIELNEDEASEIEWINMDELKKRLITEPDNFTSWFIIAAPKVLKIMELNK